MAIDRNAQIPKEKYREISTCSDKDPKGCLRGMEESEGTRLINEHRDSRFWSMVEDFGNSMVAQSNHKQSINGITERGGG